MAIKKPSIEKLLKDAKKDKVAKKCGMYLVHNGVVRETAKAKVRQGKKKAQDVKGMIFSYDEKKVEKAKKKALKMKGIYYINVWLNSGKLKVGNDIMFVLVGGDIRPNVINCLQKLVEEIKTKCVMEIEL